LVGGGDEELALAAPARLDALGRNAAFHQHLAHALGARERKPVVVAARADGIRVPDHHDVGERPALDLGEHVLELALGGARELVAVGQEIEEEARRCGGERGERRAEARLHVRFRERLRMQRAVGLQLLRAVLRVDHVPVAVMLHGDGADVAVWRGQHREERRRHRLRGAGGGEGRRDEGRCATGSSTCTTNSVPRTPMIADGVLIFIDSGACWTILPDTAASRPRESVPWNSPAYVVVSNVYLSFVKTLEAPTETRLLSLNV